MEGNLIFYFPCKKEPLIFKAQRKIPPKWEKPLKAVSMLKKRLWLTESSLFSVMNNDLLLIPPEVKKEEVLFQLKKMRKKRILWFIGLLFLFPFTWILTPIPGPNIPYFYILGRLILHFFSIRNLKKLIKRKVFLFKIIDESFLPSELKEVLAECFSENKGDSFNFSQSPLRSV